MVQKRETPSTLHSNFAISGKVSRSTTSHAGFARTARRVRYISEFGVTGLTSNPMIFEHAFRTDAFYDDAIRDKTRAEKSGEELFFELVLQDLGRAADSFRPIHEATDRIDGWVSLEVSPLLADDAAGTVSAARQLHALCGRKNPQPMCPKAHSHVDPFRPSRPSKPRGYLAGGD